MSLVVYNSLTRTKEIFKSLVPGQVKMYCCGPTVYDLVHVGNFRGAIFYNFVRNWLEYLGYKTTFVYNYTDVDDKIIRKANDEKVTSEAIAARYIEEFEKDFSTLGLRKPDFNPRVTQHIDSIIDIIKVLIEKKIAYVVDGEVLYSIAAFPEYGKLSGHNPEELIAGSRVEIDQRKQSPLDFALWKPSKPGEPSWPSPWGLGRPGWHIECSAMSLHFLKGHINLHVGGIDLRFPHHENERAQSNAITGNESVDLWLHGEHLLFEGRKMSKSAGNVVLLQEIIDRGFDPLAVRLCFLENRYRSQMDLTWAAIEAADATIKRWRKKIAGWGLSRISIDSEFLTIIDNDLDTPKAIQYLRAIEKDETLPDRASRFLFADQFLGLDLNRVEEVKAINPEQIQLLEQRMQARIEKRWSDSDSLRIKLEESGLEIKDTNTGQQWSWR